MNAFDEKPEDGLGRSWRYAGYFVLGAFLGLLPATVLVAAASSRHLAWKLAGLIVLGCGLAFSLISLNSTSRAS